MFGDNCWWIIIILLLLCCCGGNGFDRRNECRHDDCHRPFCCD